MNLLGERLHGKASDAFKRCYSLSWIRNPLYGNLAQAIETLHCLEEIPHLVDSIFKKVKNLENDVKIQKQPTGTGKNVGAVEAPRGTLYHYYEVNRGIVTGANMIIPTTQNFDAMEAHIRVAAQNLLANVENKPLAEFTPQERKDVELVFEMFVRSYDPCISCSVHLVDLDN